MLVNGRTAIEGLSGQRQCHFRVMQVRTLVPKDATIPPHRRGSPALGRPQTTPWRSEEGPDPRDLGSHPDPEHSPTERGKLY